MQTVLLLHSDIRIRMLVADKASNTVENIYAHFSFETKIWIL